MKIGLQGFILVLAISTGMAAPEKRSTRDLKAYDQGGSYEVRYAEDEPKLVRVRAFVWNHWTKKQFGRIQAIFISREGDSTIATYYVEQDRNDIWQVYIEQKISIRGLREGAARRHFEKKYRCYTLHRVVSRDSKAGKLVFKDAKGRKIDEL